MRYASIYAEGHSQNSLFSTNDPTNTYAPTFTSRFLRTRLLERGIELNTPDLNSGKYVTFELYVEGQLLQSTLIPKYLIATENPHINPLNCDVNYCSQFKNVFSWNPKISTLPNGVFVMVPNEIILKRTPTYSERPLLVALINSNKRFPKKLDGDLYEERLKLIRWYEQNHLSKFGLYGRGWDKPSPAFGALEKLTRRLKRFRTQLWGHKPFPSYLGSIQNKFEAYGHTKFGICYENTKDLTNYITEKIFDCMMEGCVPVYWGANNVLDYIPKTCFIDRRDFSDTSDLHDYLTSMDAAVYRQYQANIAQFLVEASFTDFAAECFISRVVDVVAPIR